MHSFLIFLFLISGILCAQDKPDHNKQRMTFPVEQSNATSSPTSSSTPQKGSDTIDAVSTFFLALKSGQTDAAYESLVKNTIISEKRENVAELKKRTTQALDNYGPVLGYEIIDKLEIGTCLLRYTCISLNADLPLRWRFYFYRTGAGWKLVDLRVDDGLVELFDEVARSKKINK